MTRRLHYEGPATTWLEALPIGNGLLGAMCHGGAQQERFGLNHTTGWSGSPDAERAGDLPDAAACLEAIAASRGAVARRDWAAADAALGEQLAFHQNAMGAVAGPFDAWLVLRGIKTLGVRMDRHCANAEGVVEFLTTHPAVERVLYPGLPDHPGHDIAARQMRGFGGMVSFTLRGGEQTALKVCELASVFTLGESLGGVESLIEHPARMTHASVAGSPLQVSDDLVRLSVGIESIDDLIADLQSALS